MYLIHIFLEVKFPYDIYYNANKPLPQFIGYARVVHFPRSQPALSFVFNFNLLTYALLLLCCARSQCSLSLSRCLRLCLHLCLCPTIVHTHVRSHSRILLFNYFHALENFARWLCLAARLRLCQL